MWREQGREWLGLEWQALRETESEEEHEVVMELLLLARQSGNCRRTSAGRRGTMPFETQSFCEAGRGEQGARRGIALE
jgi:hypothetical protein